MSANLPSPLDLGAIGGRLRSLRRARNMTLKDIAAGRFSVAYLSKVERGQNRPTFAVVQHYAQKLNMHLVDLLMDEDERAVLDYERRQRTAKASYPQVYAEMLVAAGELEQASVMLQDLQARLGSASPKSVLWLSAYIAYRDGNLDGARAFMQAYEPPPESGNPLEIAGYYLLRGLIALAEGAHTQAVEEYERAIRAGASTFVDTDFEIAARGRLAETLIRAQDYTRAYVTQAEALQLFDLLRNPRRHASWARDLGARSAAAGDYIRAFRLIQWAGILYRVEGMMRQMFTMLVRHALMSLRRGEENACARHLSLALVLAEQLESASEVELALALLTLIPPRQGKSDQARLDARKDLLNASVSTSDPTTLQGVIVRVAMAAIAHADGSDTDARELLAPVGAALEHAEGSSQPDPFLLLFAYDAAWGLLEQLNDTAAAHLLLKRATALHDRYRL